jgi:hypothetical protein
MTRCKLAEQRSCRQLIHILTRLANLEYTFHPQNPRQGPETKMKTNQPTPLQSRRGMEADLLPNPDSDCNLDVSLQSSGESDPQRLKEYVCRDRAQFHLLIVINN